MLSAKGVAAGKGGYYVGGIAEGLEDYYVPAEDREAPGEWFGRAALGLGLEGKVEAQEFLDLLANRDPNTGRRMRTFQAGNAAYDLTFSAPKSVSLIYAYGTDEERQAVTDAHDAAVKEALSWMEAECGGVRTGKGGVKRVEGNGWAVGLFRHRTSREGDPQLHTHAVVANLVQATTDGKWRTIDSTAVYHAATTGGALYQAHLRAELTQRLGVTWAEPVKNQAEIEGAPKALLEEFSRRSKQLQEAVGRDASRRAREAAALDTRRAKKDAPRVDIPGLAEHDARDYGVPPGRVEQWWAKRAAELDLDPRDIVEPLLGRPRTPERLDATELAEVLATELTSQHATFTRRDMIRAVTNKARDGAKAEDVLAAVELVMAHPEYVRLDPETAAPQIMERRDGRRVRVQRPDPMTTRTQLAKERAIETSVRRRLTDHAGIARTHHVEGVIKARHTLDADQAQVIRELTTSGRGVEILIGAAGSGKTFTLGAAAEAWTASGFRVIGTAHAGVAAEQLNEALPHTGQARARTIDSLLLAVGTGREQLDRRTVLIVDEAEMAGTERLAKLLNACDEKGTKLVLVGDPSQLPPIDAGGMLEALRSRFSSTLRLETNRRQQAEWEREAITHLRNGRTQPFLDAYQAEGRIHFHDSPAQRARAIALAVGVDYEAGRTALVLTGTNENVDALNAAVQQRRQEIAQLGEHLGQTARGEAIHEGERLMLRRTDTRIDVRNGQVVTVIGRTDDALIVERHDKRRVALDAAYVREHTHLGYASTTHKAQGATAEVCHFAPDGLAAKELAYVATTRGRASNQFHLTAEPTKDARAAALDRLEWDLRRSVKKEAAIDAGELLAERPSPDPQRDHRTRARREPHGDQQVRKSVDAEAVVAVGADLSSSTATQPHRAPVPGQPDTPLVTLPTNAEAAPARTADTAPRPAVIAQQQQAPAPSIGGSSPPTPPQSPKAGEQPAAPTTSPAAPVVAGGAQPLITPRRPTAETIRAAQPQATAPPAAREPTPLERVLIWMEQMRHEHPKVAMRDGTDLRAFTLDPRNHHLLPQGMTVEEVRAQRHAVDEHLRAHNPLRRANPARTPMPEPPPPPPAPTL